MLPAGSFSVQHPAAVDLEKWARFVAGMNLKVVLYFLAVVLAVIALAVLFALARLLIHGLATAAARKLASDGRPDGKGRARAPAGRGMCDVCQRTFDRVYYTPSGQRPCPGCYAAATSRQAEPEQDQQEARNE